MSKADKKLGKIKPKEKQYKDRPRGKKKPKKDTRSYEEKNYVCPFCDSYLGKMYPDKNHYFFEGNSPYIKMNRNINKFCSKCSAFEVIKACPCCHRDTWFKPDDKTVTTGEYRHFRLYSGCNFQGRKLIR